MEGVGLNRRYSKKTPIRILFLLTWVSVHTFTLTPEPQMPECPDGDFLSTDGICCNKCPPAFRLVNACPAKGHKSTCERCRKGLYMDKINYSRNCMACTECNESNNEIQVSSCKDDQNAVCRCKDGFYKDLFDSIGYNCLRCSKCRTNEQETQKCDQNNNTVCDCMANYYRVKGRCEPCKKCTPECHNHCTTVQPPNKVSHGDSENNFLINVISGAVSVALGMFVLGAFITYMVIKHVCKKNLSQTTSQQREDVPDSCEQVLIFSEESSQSCTAKPQSPTGEQEVSNLPDCVPVEIKASDLIYAVLDVVPVLQVKRLVRSLGVTDMEIEQAELDHRPSREAHYQILRAWAERGGGGPRGTLHRPLLEELLDKLRKMHQGRAAEELETKFDCL